VTFTGNLAYLYVYKLGCYDRVGMGLGWGNKECIQNANGEYILFEDQVRYGRIT
jgi:hypothetical protein